MTNTFENPRNAKDNLFLLLKDVNQDHKEIKIISEISEDNAVLFSLEDRQSIRETLMLE